MAVFTPRALQIPNMRTDYSAENSAFSNLGQTLGSMPSEFRKEQLNAQKQQILGQIGTGNMDYEKAGRSLIALGDTTAGATLLGLGQKQQERDLEKAWMGGGASLGATSTQPMGGASVTPGKVPPAEIKAIIDANVPEADREYAYRMAMKESSFNPGAVSPTGAKGLFQFTGGTGRQYGLVDRAGDIRDNPTANTQAFARFTEDNRQALRHALGRDPTYGELALAHQQGAGGAIALITGNGDVNPNNLRVNNADPNAPRSESARRIMAYYGYGNEQPAPSQTSRQPAQVAQANVPGDDPVKLRSDAQYYAQSNPEAARQLNARADALEQSRGTQVAQAAPQLGQPVADAPASGAKEAQFVLPGTGEVIPQAISTDPAVRSAMGRYVTAPTERTRAVAKQALDLAVADAKQKQAANQPTDETKNYEQFRREEVAAGRPAPTRAEYLSLKRSQNNVNLPVGEKEYDKQSAKDFAELNRDVAKRASTANGKIATLNRLETLLSDPNVRQGAGAQAALQAARIAKGVFGIDTEGLGPAEAVNAISNQFALELRNPSGGAGMPGALSDKDREFLQSLTPGLERTPEGNKLIIDYMKRLAKRDVEIEGLRRDYIKQNKRLDDGFYDKLSEFSEKNPLFPEAAKAPEKATAVPSAGHVEGGYRFNGGDPSNPKSWTKVQ